jgi:hypothetical protein
VGNALHRRDHDAVAGSGAPVPFALSGRTSHFHPHRRFNGVIANDGSGAKAEAADFNMGFRSAPIAVIGTGPIGSYGWVASGGNLHERNLP